MDVEISTDAQYGYDVRAELVMESGALPLAPPIASTISSEGAVGNRVHSDWTTRFALAYRRQATAWIGRSQRRHPAEPRPGRGTSQQSWPSIVSLLFVKRAIRTLP